MRCAVYWARIAFLSFVLSGCGGGGGGGGGGLIGGGGSISPASVSLSTSAASVAETGRSLSRTAVESNITATLSRVWSTDVIVDIKGEGTAVGGVHYHRLEDIFIPAGSLSGSTKFIPIDNGSYSGDRTCNITINSITGGVVESSGTGAQSLDLVIVEDETLSLSSNSSSIDEDSSGTITLTATLSAPATEPVTIQLGSSGTAADLNAFSSISDIVIPQGQSAATTTVSPTDNNFYDGNLAANIFINNVQGNSITPKDTQTIAVTFVEDDDPAVLSFFASPSLNLQEGGSHANVVLFASVDKPLRSTLTIPVSEHSSSVAKENSDFSSLTGQVITIPAGDLSAIPNGTGASVSWLDDDIWESSGGNETASILAAVSGRTDVTNTSHVFDILIADNDSEPTVTLSQSLTSLSETQTTEITATLSNPSDQDTVVSLIGSGTSVSGTDYAPLGDITISAGEVTGSTGFTPINDGIYEKHGVNETVSITINTVANAQHDGSQRLDYELTESTTKPALRLTSSTYSVSEAGASPVLTFALDSPLDESITFTLNTRDDSTAVPVDDYTSTFSTQQSLTMPAGQTSMTRTVTLINSNISEPDEYVKFDLSMSGVNYVAPSSLVQIDILNVGPTVSLTTDVATITEGSNNLVTLTAALSQAVDVATTVNLSIAGTGVYGTDFTTSDGSPNNVITIPANASSATLSFRAIDNTEQDPDKNITVAIASVSGGRNATESGEQEAAFSIINDDIPVTIHFGLSGGDTISEESGNSIALIATLNTTLDTDLVINCYPNPNDDSFANQAIEGVDFQTLGSMTIPAGDLTATVLFTPINDTVYEPSSEKASPVCQTESHPQYAQTTTSYIALTITDSDPAPTLSLQSNNNNGNILEGESSVINLTLSNPTYEDVTISLSTSGVATEGVDYSSLTNVVIPAGQVSASVTFVSISDETSEANEAVNIGIGSISGGNVSENGNQALSITIANVEIVPPSVTLSASSTSIAEDSDDAILLIATLSEIMESDVTVTFSSDQNLSERIEHLTIQPVVIPAGQLSANTNFIPQNSTQYNPDDVVVVSINTVSGGDAIENGNQTVSITIVNDDDAPTLTLSATSSTTTSEGVYNRTYGSSLGITVQLSNSTYQDIPVSFLVVGGSATIGEDYGSILNTVISAGNLSSTTSFNPIADTIVEGNENAIIGLASVSGGGVIADLSQTIEMTITNVGPDVSLSISESTLAENSNAPATITAQLSHAVSTDVVVSLSPDLSEALETGHSHAVEGTDYGVVSDITISSGSTTGTATITPINDQLNTGNRVATIAIDSVTGADATELGNQTVSLTITEDDTSALVTLSIDGAVGQTKSILETDGNTYNIRASLNNTADQDVVVNLGVSGTATGGGVDYTTGSGITIPAGSLSKTMSFTVTDDNVYEGADETVIYTIDSITGGSAAESGNQQLTISITENESLPVVSLSSSASTVAEDGSSLTITATLSEISSQNTTLRFVTSGSAIAGTDYAAISDLVIAAGNPSATMTFDPTADTVDENNETATIAVESIQVGVATIGEDATVDIVITNTGPMVSLSQSVTQLTEGSGLSATISACLQWTLGSDLIVNLTPDMTNAWADGINAVEGSDYLTLSDITIASGSSCGTATLTPIDNSSYGKLRHAVIGITGTSGSDIGSIGSTAYVKIIEDESVPSVTLSVSSNSIAESSGSLTVTGNLSVATFEDVTLSLSTSGSATAGSDFIALANIVIPTGQTSGSVSFTPIADGVNEGAESTTISVSSVSGGDAVESIVQTETVSITDSDIPIVYLSVSINGTTEAIIDEGSVGGLSVLASLSQVANEDITIAFNTSGSATEGVDYSTIANIVIPAGSMRESAVFDPISDNVAEGQETAVISLGTVSGGSAIAAANQTVTYTIIDTQSAPHVSLAVAETIYQSTMYTNNNSIAEGDSVLIKVFLSEAVNENVVVSLSASGTATAGVDYDSFSNITIPAGQTSAFLTFTPTVDSNSESTEQLVVDINSVSGGGAVELGVQSQIISILDPTNPLLSIRFTGDEVSETGFTGYIDENSGNSISIVGTLTSVANAPVVVHFSVAGSAKSGVDYPTIAPMTIPAGQLTSSVAFTPINDSHYEGSQEYITLTVFSATGGSVELNGFAGGGLIIREDDNAPTVSLTTSANTLDENGSAGTITATLSGVTYQDVNVSLTSTGTAIPNSDFSLSSQIITIPAGNLSSSVTLTPINDFVSESDESITLNIDSVSGGDVTENGDQSLNVTLNNVVVSPTVTLSTSETSISEDAEPITLTATLSEPTDTPVTVLISASGAANQDSDYSLSSNSFTIPAGDVSSTITLTPTGDSLAENDELATFAIDSVTGGNATENGDQLVNVTLTNVVVNPTVTLSTSAVSINEEGAAITLTATLSSASDSDVTVTLDTSGTASDSVDYLSVENIVIQSGQLTGTASFSPIDDLIFEGNETSTIAIQSVSGGGAIENGDQAVDLSITDNESNPTITLSSNALTIDEKTSGAVTITATSDVLSTADILVSLNFSGAATKGTDYSTNSESITISSGQLSNFITLTAIQDTLDEGGSETISVEINSVTGGIENGEQSRTVSIIEDALNAGTQAVFNQATTNFFATNTETLNIEVLSPNEGNQPSPYETINLPEAFGYEMGGSGELIAIMDSGFVLSATAGVTHADLDGKNITIFGPHVVPSSFSLPHGSAVASIAAGDLDGFGIHGVAPFADLHISDYSMKTGTFHADHWANATANAAAAGAVVQNNSWGVDVQLDTVQQDMITFGETAAESMAWYWSNIGFVANSTSANNYVTELNNFQNTGVIVYALSNNSNFTDADFQAAMPELFPELEEAWITAVNIDVTGSQFIRRSAPCGQTAEYCLGADGYDITVASHVANGLSLHENQFGTSFVAPQISGAIALLAEHFPNHTPEQLVDRLLATADNTFFNADGTVSFSNGVSHAYSNEFGHGVMNVYAALQPVTTSAASSRIFTGANNVDGSAVSIFETGIRSSRSFGDSIAKTLSNTTIQFYDALNGAFELKADAFAVPVDSTMPVLNISSAMGSIGSLGLATKPGATTLQPIKGALYTLNNYEKDGGLVVTFNQGNPSTQALFGGVDTPFDSLQGLRLPYLKPAEQGIGVGYVDSVDDFRFSVSTNTPVRRSDEEYFGDKKHYAGAVEYHNHSKEAALVTGLSQESDNLFGAMGSGAFSFEGSQTETTFLGTRLGMQIGSISFLNYQYVMSKTEFEGASNSLLSGASFMSDAYLVSLDLNPTTADRFSIFASSPNRVSDGSITLKLSNLADADGNLTYRQETLNLETAGRQQDIGVSYKRVLFDQDNILSMQLLKTSQPNHIQSAKSVYSAFIGLGLGRFKAGTAYDELSKTVSARIDYSLSF